MFPSRFFSSVVLAILTIALLSTPATAGRRTAKKPTMGAKLGMAGNKVRGRTADGFSRGELDTIRGKTAKNFARAVKRAAKNGKPMPQWETFSVRSERIIRGKMKAARPTTREIVKGRVDGMSSAAASGARRAIAPVSTAVAETRDAARAGMTRKASEIRSAATTRVESARSAVAIGVETARSAVATRVETARSAVETAKARKNVLVAGLKGRLADARINREKRGEAKRARDAAKRQESVVRTLGPNGGKDARKARQLSRQLNRRAEILTANAPPSALSSMRQKLTDKRVAVEARE